MNKLWIFLSFLFLIQLNGQSESTREQLNEQTKTTGGVFLRSMPNPEATLSCWVGKSKKVIAVEYKPWTGMWRVVAKNCEGYISEFSIKSTYSMLKHKREVEHAAKLAQIEKVEKERIAYLNQEAIKDSIHNLEIKRKRAESDVTSIPKGDSEPVVNKSRYTSNSKASTYTSRSRIYRSYIRGPRGGCYYINSNGNKSYVARSLCN